MGISDKQFYAWRQRYLQDHPYIARQFGISLRRKSPRNTSPQTALDNTSSTSSKCGFARIESSASIYEFSYPNGVMLRLPICISTSSLLELIRLY